jgi:hypothetical protein
MTAARHNPRLDLATAIWRVLWAGIFALHLWPLAKLSLSLAADPVDWERWGSWSALLLATSFFAAKMLGARALKVSSPLAGAVLFLVAGGLVHGDRLVGDEGAAVGVAIVSTTAVVAAVRFRPRLPECFARLGSQCQQIIWILSHGTSDPECCTSRRLLNYLLIRPPRGPPLART